MSEHLNSVGPRETLSHRLAAWGAVVLMLLGVGYALTKIHHLGITQYAPTTWLDGTVGRELEGALKLPSQDILQGYDAAWRYRILGQLGPQVREGCPGWLFYADGLRPPPGAEAAYTQHLTLMGQAIDQLRAAKVHLLVVTVPDKARIENNALCGLSQTPVMRERLDTWSSALQAKGVSMVDLRAALQTAQPAFFRTDVHLNENGAAAAAQAVATAALKILGSPGTQDYRVESTIKPETRVGDLLMLAGLEHTPNDWRPPPDTHFPQTIEAQISGGLLDDTPAVEIMLAGSSNSRRSNFAEQIGMKLGRPIWNVSKDGGKFAESLIESISEREKWPSSLKLIIWEMSEMSLSQALSDVERTALPQAVGGSS